MAASYSSQPVTQKHELCTNLKKTSIKKLLKPLDSRKPREEVKERRRCFIATSLSNDSQDRMTLDESKSKRLTLAMTKEQETDFFKSLWKSVPEKSAANCSMHGITPPELNVMIDKKDVPSESSREDKSICDINGNLYQDKSGINLITIEDDASSNIEPISTSRSMVDTSKIFKIRAFDSGKIRGIKDSTATVCDPCCPVIGDSNNASTCDDTQTKTKKIPTNVEVPQSNCRDISSLMKARVIRVDQSQRSPTLATLKSPRSGAKQPNLETFHLTRRTGTDSDGNKGTRSVLTQTSPTHRCNHSSSGQSINEKAPSRKGNNDLDFAKKRPSQSLNNVKIRQGNHFGRNNSNSRPKFSYAGQRRKFICQNNGTQCACVGQCPKRPHPKQDLCNHSTLHNDANTCSSCRKCQIMTKNSVTHAQTQFRICNLCSNFKEKTNQCAPNPCIRDNTESSSSCRCSIQKQSNATTVNKYYLHSGIPKQKNIPTLINNKTCGSKQLRQGVPSPTLKPCSSFRSPSENQQYLERCSCYVSTEDSLVCGRCDEEIQEESSYRNELTSAPPEFCHLCCVRGNSDKQMKSHFKGNRHRRMVRESAKKCKTGERVLQCTCAEDMTDDHLEVLTYQTTSANQRLNPERESVVVHKIVVIV